MNNSILKSSLKKKYIHYFFQLFFITHELLQKLAEGGGRDNKHNRTNCEWEASF